MKPTEETRKKISDSLIGKPWTEKRRAAYEANKSNHGMKHASDETRKKMSDAKAGVPKSESHKAAISKGNKGKPKSESHKAAMKEAWARRKAVSPK